MNTDYNIDIISKPGDQVEQMKNSIPIVKKCVERDIVEANIYRELLFKWMNGMISREKFYKKFPSIFNFVGQAMETKYVLALGKLYANSNEASIWRLIQLVKALPESDIEIRIDRAPEFFREKSRQKRKEFLSLFEEYEKRIPEIKKEISALRNTQRAHNNPWWQSEDDVTWNRTKEWTAYAETMYVCALDGICDSRYAIELIVPSELRAEIAYFLHCIDEYESFKSGFNLTGEVHVGD